MHKRWKRERRARITYVVETPTEHATWRNRYFQFESLTSRTIVKSPVRKAAR